MNSKHIGPLIDTKGKFVFLDRNYKKHNFTDFQDIPENLEITQILCFLPNLPPSPHTIKEHEVISKWKQTFKDLFKKTYS